MEVECILKKDLLINCSWNADLGCQNLKSVVKFSTEPRYDLDDIVQVESCIHLCKSGSSDVPCKINFKLDKKTQFVINRVDIVSEARIIESYGSYEEYIDTLHGEYLDDFEGCTVYSISSRLPSTKEVTLKFARMKHENQMWLYGIMFTVEQQMAVPQLRVAGIDLSNVNKILKGTGQPISEKAEHCKKLLQQCGNSIDNTGAIDPHVLLKMFEGEYLQPLGETSKSMSKCLMRLIPFIVNKSEQQLPENSEKPQSDTTINESTADPAGTESGVVDLPLLSNNNHKNFNNNVHVINDGSVMEDCIQTIKDYVDKRINDMEEKLTIRLEKRIKDLEIAQNVKLDNIMKLLLEKK